MITLRNAIENIITTVRETSSNGVGGPFGAFVYKSLYKEGDEEYIEVIAYGTNGVTSDNDPTAHAEIVAIRKACKALNTYDLSEYSIYATGFPCPMCMGAIIWSGIKNVTYCQSLDDTHNIGFKDKEMYESVFSSYLTDNQYITTSRIPNDEMNEIYNSYKQEGIIY